MKFLKLYASGNDFVVTEKQILTKKQIVKICDRNFGVGCDQYINISNFDFEKKIIDIEIFNQDGTFASMCGNAMRALCGFYLKNGEKFIIKIKNGKEAEIEKTDEVAEVEIKNVFIENGLVNTGNLHKIFIIKNENEIDFNQSDEFNKNYVKIIDDKTIEVLTIEKGVGETLSCGSGICASVFFCVKNKIIKSDFVNILTKGAKKLNNVYGIEDKILVKINENSLKLCGGYGFSFKGEFIF